MQPGNPLWNKIRRYLILWGVIFVILCLAALFKYWDQIIASLGTGIGQIVSGIMTFVIVAAIFLYLLRALFR